MRIGLIAPPWVPVPPTAYGGTEAVVDALATGLEAAGHSVLLAASSDSTSRVERPGGFAPAVRSGMGQSISELPHVIRAYEALAGVDLIHDHTLSGPLYRHRPPGIPVVSTMHTVMTPELRSVYRMMARDTALVAISRNQAAAAPDVPIARVIHHGVDPAAIPFGEGRGGYALFLGRMDPTKGVVEAVMAARAAGIRLKIAAKMSARAEVDYYREAVEPLLGGNEEFLGEPDAAGKLELLGGALALINPLQWDEPFGMVMIESLAAGTPVVAIPRGAAPEIIDDGVTGFLRNGTEELGEALRAAAGLDRHRCRTAVEHSFSAELMARRHAALYAELLGGRPS
ncbi:glycosyltransferase family 4 protein [Arthrobacter cupressi]|uniref:Glycosyltransferase involved in cell wall bisynthesis n=1 Tax=Arthrobacter cupressi TaxID=1045773 RepID=A0A1G8SH21_9MICC|nr:glycosyltransferase family 4 protein [Arthrobacter cupressi]NYD78505.1 glycosyltransferase involved in cell wall biosynthesis [Arthrobacter cupressi]SDJ28536.1 Glycosyltransferase involved in cell wall bisynthesis [Arthrobacter cupressi]